MGHAAGQPAQPGQLLGSVQLAFEQLPLDRVGHGLGQQAAVEMALDQVILGTFADRGQGEVTVARAADDHNRDPRGPLQDRPDHLEAAPVRQP